jgi:uncharacterized membrane protein HdeD (DUF308 family)
MVLIFFIWVWAIATGILRIAEAIRLRKEISGEHWLALSGAVTLVFGFWLLLRPVTELVTLAGVIAVYAVLLGLFEVLLGLELRAVGKVA